MPLYHFFKVWACEFSTASGSDSYSHMALLTFLLVFRLLGSCPCCCCLRSFSCAVRALDCAIPTSYVGHKYMLLCGEVHVHLSWVCLNSIMMRYNQVLILHMDDAFLGCVCLVLCCHCNRLHTGILFPRVLCVLHVWLCTRFVLHGSGTWC